MADLSGTVNGGDTLRGEVGGVAETVPARIGKEAEDMRHRPPGPGVPAREAPKVKIGIAAIQQMIVFAPDDDGIVHAVEHGFEHPNRDGIACLPFIDPCYVADFHNDIPVIENEMALFFCGRNLQETFRLETLDAISRPKPSCFRAAGWGRK
tara:strand:- start:317 stop:772 length:456 start_codon:yes stop_codon:yes gene_type:complete